MLGAMTLYSRPCYIAQMFACELNQKAFPLQNRTIPKIRVRIIVAMFDFLQNVPKSIYIQGIHHIWVIKNMNSIQCFFFSKCNNATHQCYSNCSLLSWHHLRWARSWHLHHILDFSLIWDAMRCNGNIEFE